MCVIYENNNKYYWFEHAMGHMRGIHQYDSMDAAFKDIAKNWFRCVYDAEPDGSETDNFPLADKLEFREIDRPITHVSNYELAKRCYKFKLLATEDISENPTENEMMNEAYSLPYFAEELRANYGRAVYNNFCQTNVKMN